MQFTAYCNPSSKPLDPPELERRMYIRPVHAELDVPTLQEFIRKYPLGLFTTSINHPDHPTIQTTHIPFVLDVPNSPFPHNDPSPEGDETYSVSPPNLGTLRGHMARANPQTKAMISSLTPTQSYSLMRLCDQSLIS